MGNRGPAPTPTALLKLRGSWRGEINKNEPMPDRGIPDMPEELEGITKECWEQLAPLLDEMGVLTKADSIALQLLCETFANWKRTEELLKQSGDVYPIRDDNGDVKYLQQSPYVSISRNYANALKGMLREFGLTPSARSRIEVSDKSVSDANSLAQKYLAS
jgi:P27 family predicted phage terminase small subunit